SAVVAHELAHARYRDVAAGTARTALVAATAVTGLYLLGQWPPVLRLAGAETLADPRAVPLVVALAAVAGVVLAPVQAAWSRRVEARADAFGLALTGDPDGQAAMFARLAATNLADPDPPRRERLLASHPPVVERIAAARTTDRGPRCPAPSSSPTTSRPARAASRRSSTTWRCTSRPGRWWCTRRPGGARPPSTPASRSRWSARTP